MMSGPAPNSNSETDLNLSPKADESVSSETSFLAQLSGAEGEGGALPSDEPSSGRKSGILVLAVVLVAAGGVLFAMRTLGTRTPLKIADIKIDYPLDSNADVKSDDHLKVLHDLRSVGNVAQVPLRDLQGNPFEWPFAQKTFTPQNDTMSEAEREAERVRREREALLRRRQDAFRSLTLNSVVGGRVPVARISDQVVRVGDPVGEFFTVKSITGRSVELKAEDGQLFILQLGE